MQADQLSAVGGLVGAGVAFVALGVSIYAAIIARRSADSTKDQAVVAHKTYRMSAKPTVNLRIQAARQLDNEFSAFFSVERSGGPPELMYRCGYTAFLHLDVPGPELQKTSDGMSEWVHLDEEHVVATGVQFTVEPPHASAEMLLIVIEAEMIEPSSINDSTAIPWRKQEWLEWVRPDLISEPSQP